MSAARIPGIPTRHKGRQFRSRLEARWATFFDMLGWKYEYEPFDLNGWIPDFVLFGGRCPLLVEVKPVVDYPREAAAKVLAANPPNDEILILGCTIQVDLDDSYPDSPVLGWLLATGHGAGCFSTAAFGCWEGEFGPDRIGFTSVELDWGNRVGPGGGKYYWHDRQVNQAVHHFWVEAGNQVQWKAPR